MKVFLASALVALVAAAPPPRAAAGPAQSPPPAAAAALVDQAFRSAYELDFDRALDEARRAVALDPSHASTHRGLASVLWLNIMFLRGTATCDSYLGGTDKSRATLPAVPPALDAEFHDQIRQAIAIAQARLDANKKDVDAEYDLGTAYALDASYTASIEGRYKAAIGSAKRAYDAQERVLDLAPDRVEAGLVVGTYRYLVAVMSFPKRLFAYFYGFGGGKDKGIHMIEAAAEHGSARADARLALVLIYNREGRYDDAVRTLHLLERDYPQNRLLVLEEGGTDLRAGRAADAERVLDAGIARLATDDRPRMPSERALWFYKRGAARVLLNRRAEAAADLREALAAHPIGWVEGRTQVELGKIADLDGDRPRALALYATAQRLCGDNHDPACLSEVGQLQRQPFSLAGG